MKKLFTLLFVLMTGLFFMTENVDATGDSPVKIEKASKSVINSLSQEDKEFIKDATPENPVFIYEWSMTPNNSSLRAAAPQVSGYTLAKHTGGGIITTTFSGTGANCVIYQVNYRMWHGDGNFHDKTTNMSKKSFSINDKFVTRNIGMSLTVKVTGQISTSLGWGTIVAAPKVVWVGY